MMLMAPRIEEAPERWTAKSARSSEKPCSLFDSAARREDRGDGQRGAGNVEPVAEVVHPREGHVRRPDLQRHEVVAEAAEERGNDHEEHHQNAVGRDRHVPQVAVRGADLANGSSRQAHPVRTHVLRTGVHQLHPHVDGEDDRDQADKPAGEKIEDADVLVVRRHEPADEEVLLSVVIVAVDGCVRHWLLPFRFPCRSVCGVGYAGFVIASPRARGNGGN